MVGKGLTAALPNCRRQPWAAWAGQQQRHLTLPANHLPTAQACQQAAKTATTSPLQLTTTCPLHRTNQERYC